jgi:hypothetical protein
MTKKVKIKGLLVGFYIITPLVITGCSQTKTPNTESYSINSSQSEEKEESKEDDNIKIEKDVVGGSIEEIEEKIILDKNDLAGTCPKGDHCSTPGKCGLFIDRGDNQLCNRGE